MSIFIGLFILICVVYVGSYICELDNKKRISERDALFWYAVLTLVGMAVIYVFIYPVLFTTCYEIEIKR